ncbi:MAG: DNA topoisomerase IB [Ktedonobacterales bacterium]
MSHAYAVSPSSTHVGKRRTVTPQQTIPIDPVDSAKMAGLRYVTDTGPGIRRERVGESFSYIGLDGKPIRDSKELDRIKSLGIPPAWTDVWICPNPLGHLQATGRDTKGRKQYRYHPRWREVRDATKYDRMIVFGTMLPMIRAHISADLAHPGLPRNKVLAAVVRLLDETYIRVGNEEYVRENNSYGLTTLQRQHVQVKGSKLHFQFRGKHGKEFSIEVQDPRVAQIIKRCQELPGHELFEYVDYDGKVRSVESFDVNTYLREISGQEFTAKYFRTWAGTVITAYTLTQFEPVNSETQAKKNIAQAIKAASQRLGNTPAICRKCYVHPGVLDAYLDGSLLQAEQAIERSIDAYAVDGLRPEEAKVLTLLRRLEDQAQRHIRETAKKAS